ncbi:MAG: cobalt ECF transporter T component CbiQ [Anaerolineales bacterium]|nr:cobalt ECF transporter T component CbiQ [Anaerolineales bacterium]
MQFHALDRYQTGDSFLHRLDPRVKVIGAVAIILATVLLPDGAWLAFLLTWLLLLALSYATGLGWDYAVKRSFVVLPFLLAAVTVMFSLPGRPLLGIQLGPWQLILTDTGLIRFSSILIRSLLAVQAAILLVAATRFPDLMHALRHLHLPAVLVAIVSFMVRYLTVLGDEVKRLLRAREARSAAVTGQRAGGTWVWRAQVAGSMVGQLFLRSYERSDRLYQAMLARGYQGEWPTSNAHQMARRDWLALFMLLLLLLFIQLIGRL